jgi:GNAT superfamily N-acetyltransferase
VTLRVGRARLEEVQPLAAEYRRDASLEGLQVDAPLPTGALFWRATDGDQAVGYAAGTLRPEGIVLGPFYVRASHRRGGVGRALLAEIERWAEGARIPVLEVSVAADNAAGVRFLESSGYRTRRLLLTKSRPDSAGGPG